MEGRTDATFCYPIREHKKCHKNGTQNNIAIVVHSARSKGTITSNPPFLDLGLSTTNSIVSSNIYDKRDGFNFEIVISNFLVKMFLAPLPMVYIFRNILAFFLESMF